MTARTVVHDTISIERRLAGARPAAVFDARADPAVRAQWDQPWGEFRRHRAYQDFRIGLSWWDLNVASLRTGGVRRRTG